MSGEKELEQSKRLELVYLPGSPWSHRSLWALSYYKTAVVAQSVEDDEGSAPYSVQLTPYIAFVSEPWLRWRLGRLNPFDKISVPVLFYDRETKQQPVAESFDIAMLADNQYKAQKKDSSLRLFPDAPEHIKAIREWNTLADVFMGYCRQVLLAYTVSEPQAGLKWLPPPMRRLGVVSTLIVKSSFSLLLRKYQTQTQRSDAIAILRKLADTVRDGHVKYLVGQRFSYADIVMAIAMCNLWRDENEKLSRRKLKAETAQQTTPLSPAKGIEEASEEQATYWFYPDVSEEDWHRIVDWMKYIFEHHHTSLLPDALSEEVYPSPR